MRKPFFKKSHAAWYVHHHGKMVRLGPDKDEAFRRYHELKAADAPAAVTDSVASLCNSFLAWCEQNRSPRTYEWYADFISSFVRSVGTSLQIGRLKPLHVTQWLDSNTSWNQTTKYGAVRAVKRVFNWAVREGRLDRSPLRSLERPTPKRRETSVQPDQFDAILERVKDQEFRDYLVFMYETGTRPQEARVVAAAHCDVGARRVVLPPSDAKGKQYPRVIYLTDRAAEIVKRLVDQHSAGPILRNTSGNPWVKSSVNCRFRRLREKLAEDGLSIPGLCATSLRHGFATTALKNGVDPVTVSILMGHSDASQVARTYQHLAADPEFLTSSLDRVRASGG